MGCARPAPPAAVRDALFGMRFAPAPELLEWVRENILDEDGPLYTEDHAHLRDAEIGILWASSGFVKAGRRILGTAEVPMTRGNAWQRARADQQLAEWFGPMTELDFLITVDAFHLADCSNTEFCALLEHELYHCGHARDEFGIPKYNKSGKPVFYLRPHDVEEFVGVVARYGVGNPAGHLADLIRAAASGPEEGIERRIGNCCGTCLAKA